MHRILWACSLLLLCFFAMVRLAMAGANMPAEIAPVPFVAAGAAVVTASTSVVHLGMNARYRQAADGELLPEQLRNTQPDQWQINTQSTLNLGFQLMPHWFVLDLETGSDIPPFWILEQPNPMIDVISVFLYADNQLLKQWHTGDRFPFAQRPVENAKFLFPLELKPQQRYQLYIRVDSTEAMEIPLTLAEQFRHAITSEQRAMVDGLLHGFLFIMVAYSLAIFMVLRDITYVYYSAYVFSMLTFFLSQQGLLYQYVFPASPALQHYTVALVSMFIFLSITLFFREFLDFRSTLPRTWLTFKVLLWLHAAFCLALPVVGYHQVIILMAMNTALASILTASAIIRLALRGSRSAQIVLVGWAMLLLCMILFVAARTGVFYNEFIAAYGLRLGISVEILIFSFALSFRFIQEREVKEWALHQINQERADRIRAQELALQNEIEANQAKEKALQIEIGNRENLQQLVEERTGELERTLRHLETANRELQQLSSKDGLTDLFNRRIFDIRLNELWEQLGRRAQPLAVMIIDLDHFKQINDTRGHLCGDHVLKEFAALLKGLLHRPGDVIARYGGEEFAILLPETPCEGAEHVADVIVKAAAEKIYIWEGATFHVTASIGVSTVIPATEEARAILLERADEALYKAKAQGRNRTVVNGGEGNGMVRRRV